MTGRNSGLVISLFVGLIISLLYLSHITEQLELSLGYDSTFLLKKKTQPYQKIKIIGIDQKSLDLIGEYPWRRALYSQLIEYLGSNPKVIGFDIILSEKSLYPQDDMLLAETLKARKNVILPVSLEPSIDSPERMSFVYPLEEFLISAKSVGLTHYFPDEDGITRKTPLNEVFNDSKDKLDIFSYQISKVEDNKNIYNFPEIIYCNFQGREDAFKIYSFYDIISKKVPAEEFKDSIVLVGATAEGLQDRISSPIGPIYGVIYHAQMISNLIKNEYIRPVSKATNILLIFIVSVAAYLIWKYFGTVNQLLLITSSVLLLYSFHIIAFSNNIWISIVSIIIANFTTFISLILYEQLKISQALRLELDNLINNFKNRNLQYEINKSVDINDISFSKNSKNISNTTRVGALAELGNALTLERSFLETLLNNIKIPIVVTDKNSFVVLANPTAEEFFNIEKEDDSEVDINILLEKRKLIGKRLVDITSSLPDLKADLIGIYENKKELPISFNYERGDSVYHVRLLSLQANYQKASLLSFLMPNSSPEPHLTDIDTEVNPLLAKSNKSDDWNMICIIEDVTNWHQMANKDGLTGLWNQRYFKEYLQKEVYKSQRYKNNLSLIMMDVDHFKNFNDTYGHQTGDIVLKSIAKVLQENQRNTDIAARYGGEEFAIILTMTDEEGAFIFADRVRKEIERLEILDINGKPVRPVTSSLGIAFFEVGSSVSDFIECADEALYLCKDRGRNCVIRYSEKEEVEKQLKLEKT